MTFPTFSMGDFPKSELKECNTRDEHRKNQPSGTPRLTVRTALHRIRIVRLSLQVPHSDFPSLSFPSHFRNCHSDTFQSGQTVN